jgi:hypothetical protein
VSIHERTPEEEARPHDFVGEVNPEYYYSIFFVTTYREINASLDVFTEKPIR